MQRAVAAPVSGTAPVGAGAGVGTSAGGGDSAEFARLAGLRKRGLDVVFVVDATGSMGWVLTDIARQVREIADALRSLVPLTRIGVVAYRDTEDPDFLVKMQPLTYSTQKLEHFLSALRAAGGGGLEEDVDAGIEAAVGKAGWRNGAQAIMVLVGDGPPRSGSLGRIRASVRDFARAGGQVVVVDVSDQANPELVEREIGRKVDHAMYRRTPMYAFERIAEAANTRATTLRGDLVLPRALVGLVLGIDAKPLLAAAGTEPRRSLAVGRADVSPFEPDAPLLQEAAAPGSEVLRHLTDRLGARARAAAAGALPPTEVVQTVADVRWLLQEAHRRQRALERARGGDETALEALYGSVDWRNLSYAYDWLPCWLGWLELAESDSTTEHRSALLQIAQTAFRSGLIRVWRPELVVQSSRGLARIALAEKKPSEALRLLRATRANYASRVPSTLLAELDTDMALIAVPADAVSSRTAAAHRTSASELARIDALISQQLRFGIGAAEAAPLILGLQRTGNWDERLAIETLRDGDAFADQDIGALGDLAVAEAAFNNGHDYSAVESYTLFFRAVPDAPDRGLARYRYRNGLACLRAGLNACALQIADDLERGWKIEPELAGAIRKLRFLACYARAREVPSAAAHEQLRQSAQSFLSGAPDDPDGDLARLALARPSTGGPPSRGRRGRRTRTSFPYAHSARVPANTRRKKE